MVITHQTNLWHWGHKYCKKVDFTELVNADKSLFFWYETWRELAINLLELRLSRSRFCRKWRVLAANDALWSNLFKERWGGDSATFYAPNESKSWKDVYIVQDRCDRFGLGLKIIREGSDYFLIHQGEIQRYLGSGKPLTRIEDGATPLPGNEEHQSLIADGFLFFLGDLETACAAAKRVKM